MGYIETDGGAWVRSFPTFCECGEGRLHDRIRVLETDLAVKHRNHSLIFVSEACIKRRGLNPEDEPFENSGAPGYIVCSTTRKPVI
ncbi:hypothetical protein A3E46_02620 [Candidatus Woesebacteria bacterium RIFCSPHIGHO2_12_FULL_46_16]|uniref:Uncharacterized protein n=1 Tax=Candidatus Woesebacteria bacterium RIFCSPHIGHO2_12_FULL_46_16 TaxID=1802513 RepID=A0A1F8B169_9BACT|nr:MAG: hypothetical protein A3E46_02620 [Candidatus Woesebacteria bacterium RIFCSPHIGHO2_12_FULL_46_16]